jgi:hypothetical protein
VVLTTHPHQAPWGPPSLLYNGYRVFPGGKGTGGVVLTTLPPSKRRGLKLGRAILILWDSVVCYRKNPHDKKKFRMTQLGNKKLNTEKFMFIERKLEETESRRAIVESERFGNISRYKWMQWENMVEKRKCVVHGCCKTFKGFLKEILCQRREKIIIVRI